MRLLFRADGNFAKPEVYEYLGSRCTMPPGQTISCPRPGGDPVRLLPRGWHRSELACKCHDCADALFQRNGPGDHRKAV